MMPIAAAAMIACSAGCKPKNEAEETITANRAKLEQAFAAAKQIGDKAKALPPLAKDAVTLEAGPVKISGEVNGTAAHTAMMDDLEGLASPSSPPTFRNFKLDQGGQLGWCAKLLGMPRASKQAVQDAFALCTGAKYLLVMRVLEHKPPKVDAASKTYQSGLVRGEVRLFAFPSGKELGGFRFKAENDDVASGSDAASVESNLAHRVKEAVNAGIRTHFPSG